MADFPLNLNFSEIGLALAASRAYQVFVSTVSPQTGVLQPPQRTDVPNIADLQRLNSDLEALRAAAIAREAQLRHNSDVVRQWLKKNDKTPAIPPVASGSSGSASPNINLLTGITTTNATAGLIPPTALKVEKKSSKQGLVKLKLKDEPAFKTDPDVANPSTEDEFSPQSGTSVSPQLLKKRKRDKEPELDPLEAERVERRDSVLFRKSDDGTVKIAITQNGKLKVKVSNTSPPPPPSSLLPPPLPGGLPKPPSRSNTPKLPKPKAAKGSAEKMKIKHQKRRVKSDADDVAFVPPSEERREDSSTAVALNGDYSKAKAPPNQIPIAQFWSFCESQYFRPLQDEDFKFLDDKGDDVSPFVIPILGRPYLDQWAEEEGALFQEAAGKVTTGSREYEEIDDTVFGGDIYLHSLTEKILASLRDEGLIKTFPESYNEDDVKPGLKGAKVRTATEMMVVEDRLKNEIKYLGLIGDDEAEGINKEDDEITMELRRLQSQLADQIQENAATKHRLKELASFYRGWEQYNSVLDLLSKQIESDFVKRFQKQNPKNKKRVKPSHSSRSMPDGTLENIQKRQTLIDKIGCLFTKKEREDDERKT